MMTAVEYLNKKNGYTGWFVVIGLFLSLAMAAIFGFAYWHLSFRPKPETCFGWCLGGCAVGGALIILSDVVRIKILKRQHPEMAHLDKWIAIFGSAEKYPVNRDDEILLIPELLSHLRTSAQCVNLAIAMRDCIKAMNTFSPGSPEWGLGEAFRAKLEREAEAQSNKYFREWDLLRDSFTTFPIADLGDAITYRHSLLKKS